MSGIWKYIYLVTKVSMQNSCDNVALRRNDLGSYYIENNNLF